MLTQTIFDLAFLKSNTSAQATISLVSPDEPQFGTLVRWFDADSYSATKVNNDFLSSSDPWTDQSSASVPATPVDAAKPQFKTNIFGSKPAVLFNAPTAKMTHPNTLSFDNFTFIIVSSGSSDAIIPYHQGVNMQVRICRANVNFNSFFPNNSPEILSDELGTPLGHPKANVWIRSGSIITFFENGTKFGSGSNSPTYTTTGLGSNDGGPLGNCHVGNILFYSTPMSDATYQLLYTNYLKPRFGLP